MRVLIAQVSVFINGKRYTNNVGDNKLIGFDFSLSEGKDASSCKIEYYSNNDNLVNELFNSKIGGDIAILMPNLTFLYKYTGVEYSIDGQKISIFGQSSVFNLTRNRSNISFTNVTLKQIIKQYTDESNIELEMMDDGIVYNYFPIVSKNIWQGINDELIRRGYYVSVIPGETTKLKIQLPKEVMNDSKVYLLAPNINTRFSYKSETSNDGITASSSSKQSLSTEAKKYLDPLSGNIKNTSVGEILNNKSIDGSHLKTASPIYQNESVKKIDAVNKANKSRLNGITLNASLPCDRQLLALRPNDLIVTNDHHQVLNRNWLLKSISHSIYNDGYNTTIEAVSPIKEKIK